MATSTDIEIYNLLKSEDQNANNKGGLLLEKTHKKKAISYLRNSFSAVSAVDLWQDAAIIFVMNIRRGVYQTRENAAMFTYLCSIMKYLALKELKNGEMPLLDEKIDYPDPGFDPQQAFEKEEFRLIFESCLQNHHEPYKTLLFNIYSLGLRLKDFHKSLGIDTYNNAKVKHHTAKQKLMACMKSKMDDTNG